MRDRNRFRYWRLRPWREIHFVRLGRCGQRRFKRYRHSRLALEKKGEDYLSSPVLNISILESG